MMNAMDLRTCKRKNIIVYIIYSVLLMYFVFKAFFYYSELDNAPDVVAHLSYIYYEYQHPYELIPNFKEIPMLNLDFTGDKAYITEQTSNICYLGHPPLYYKLMAFTGCVKQDGSGIYFDLLRICIINISIVCLGLIVCLEYGRQKIQATGDYFMSHLLFATIVTNVPLIPYLAGYATNDNLLYLALGITMWGLEWGIRGKRDYRAYWTIALGLCMAVLTKLTLGLILLIATVFVAVCVMLKERSVKLLAYKQFGSTLILYAIPCVYFAHQKIVYNSVQPGLSSFSPETYKQSIWAVPSGITRTIGESVSYYWEGFWRTWTNVYSHFISHDKSGTFANVIYGIFAGFFILFTFYYVYKLLRAKDINEQLVLVAVNVGALLAMLYQFLPKIKSYMNGGGAGFSARYYVCCIGVFALSATLPLNTILSKKGIGRRASFILQMVTGLMVLGWIYYDFIYFLTSFSMLFMLI